MLLLVAVFTVSRAAAPEHDYSDVRCLLQTSHSVSTWGRQPPAGHGYAGEGAGSGAGPCGVGCLGKRGQPWAMVITSNTTDGLVRQAITSNATDRQATTSNATNSPPGGLTGPPPPELPELPPELQGNETASSDLIRSLLRRWWQDAWEAMQSASAAVTKKGLDLNRTKNTSDTTLGVNITTVTTNGSTVVNVSTAIRAPAAGDPTLHGDHNPNSVPDWHPWVVFFTMVIMLFFLFLELFPAWLVLLTALGVVWNLGIISSRDAIKGFSNEALITVGALMVVVNGADKPGLIARAAHLCLGSSSTEKVALIRFCCLVFCAGTFISNTPLIALLMPVVRDWARTRDFAPSKFLMPMAYSSICGGYMCMIGASTHLLVNGMLEEATGERFGFFAPLPLGVCGSSIAMWYLLTVGVQLLPAHKGGLFRTLKEKTSDMVCEIQFMNECPLVGVNVWEALDRLEIPRGALLKVTRQPVKLQESPRPGPTPGAPSSVTAATSPKKLMRRVPSVPEVGRVPSGSSIAEQSSVADPGLSTPSATYGDRTRAYWGTFPRPRRRPRAQTEPTDTPVQRRARRRAALEIFPVPEHEVLEGEDTLLLSLPQKDLIDLVKSPHAATVLREVKRQTFTETEAASQQEPVSEASQTALTSEEASEQEVAKSILVADVDPLEVPGVQDEFLELVVSRSNPFIGKALEGDVRKDFERHYSVAILAIRNNWAETSGDQMMSRVNSRKGDFKRVTLRGDSSEFDLDTEERARRELRQPPLGPGDAVLVLTRLEDFKRAARGHRRDFLATTAVAQAVDEAPDLYDYVPTLLFAIVLFLVAINKMAMVQGMVLLMLVYVLGGWVDRRQVTDCINWEMLILIGSALGMAKAVQDSGLSSMMATSVQRMDLGRHGTVYILFLFVMLLSELVTNSAAAALGFPLALDIANAMGLQSVKPLAMTVILASATCFASPISSPATLMVMGPGNYSFVDFLKVGLGMDLIYWIICSSMLPVFYPLTLE